MASPFSCDKMFVFDPSARSHKMIVPSTDADAKTPPYKLRFGEKKSFFCRLTHIRNRKMSFNVNYVKPLLNREGATLDTGHEKQMALPVHFSHMKKKIFNRRQLSNATVRTAYK